MHRDPGLGADPQGLVNRVEDPVGFVAHVAGVESLVSADNLGESDQLVGLRKGPGQVDQTGGQAHRAISHRLVDQVFHLG